MSLTNVCAGSLPVRSEIWTHHPGEALASPLFEFDDCRRAHADQRVMVSAEDDRVSRRPHQFRTRNDLNKAQQTRSTSTETEATSTELSPVLPLITVWLQVRVLPGPSPVAELQGNRDQAHAGVGRLPGAELRRQRSHVRIVSGAPVSLGSVPGTWVTVYSDDIGNTFGPKGFARGSSLQVSSSKYPRS